MSRTNRKAIEDAYRFCNDRARLLHGLTLTFKALGVPETQQQKIIKAVRAADFEPLKKLLKIKETP